MQDLMEFARATNRAAAGMDSLRVPLYRRGDSVCVEPGHEPLCQHSRDAAAVVAGGERRLH